MAICWRFPGNSGQITNYINQNIRNGKDVTLTTEDGDLLQITRDTAGKAQFRNLVKQPDGKYLPMTDEQYATKLRAEGHIDELARISARGNKTVPDRGGKHGEMASDGWNYRTAYFEDADGKYYRLTISTAKHGDAATIYNINRIQSEKKPYSIDGTSAHESGALWGSQARVDSNRTSASSIPNSSGSVNYPAPFGVDAIEWGRRKRKAANAKTALAETAALYNVDTETYAAAEKLARETGANIVFDGTLGAKENGYYQNGEIHINPRVEGNFAVVFAHELTHHLEGTDAYRELLSYISSRLGDEAAQKDAIDRKIAEYYRGSSGRVKLTAYEARTELVAEYISENLFSNEAEILRLAKANLGLAQRVRGFLSRLAAKVTGSREKQYLLNAERLYRKAVKEAEESSASDPDDVYRRTMDMVQFSIRETEDGEQIVVVDTRQDIFEGKPKKEYAKIARKEILEHFKGQTLPLSENDLARVTGKTAGEYAHPHTELADSHYQAKMKAATELDNLLKTAEYVYSAEDTKGHKEATLGFDYYKTKFVVDGHTFEGLLNIATSENGRMLYDVTKIKEVPLSATHATRMAQSASTSLGDFYANSIPNSSENVNNAADDEGDLRPIRLKTYAEVEAEKNGGRKFSLSDAQEDIDKAVELLDNGSTPSEVFNQTGLVVMANGDIYNGIGGEKIGVYQHGGAESDAGRMGSSVQIARPGDNRGRDRGALAGTEAPVRRKGWEELGNGEKRQITSAVERRMKRASEEGKIFLERSGGVEALSERFYSVLGQGRTVAEQWSNFIPDIQGLMDEVEAAAGEADGRKYSFAKEETAASDPDYQQMVEQYGAIPGGEKPHGREVQVPQSTDGKDKVRRYARTLMEAPQTPDEFIPAFQQQVKNGLFSYHTIHDKESLEKATKVLTEEGWQGGLDQWQEVVNDNRMATKDDITLAQVMYAEACKVGDMETSQRLAAQIAAEGTLQWSIHRRE